MWFPWVGGHTLRFWFAGGTRVGVLAPLLVAAFLLGAAISASANLTVSPPVLDLRMTEGTRRTLSLHVVNTGAQAGQIRVRYADWEQDFRGQTRLIAAKSFDRSLAGWVNVTPSVFELDPGQEQEIALTVEVPPGAAGTYWGALVLEFSPQIQPAFSTADGVDGAVVWMMQTVPGTEERQGKVLRVQAVRDWPRGTLDGAFDATLLFVNSGNTFVIPEGWFEVRDATGLPLWRKRFEPTLILPGRMVEIVMPYNGPPLAPGRYVLLGIVDYGDGFRVAGQSLFSVR